MIWPAPFEWLSIRLNGWLAHGAVRTQRDGAVGGFVLGTTLGLVWTPCAGPVLGSILTLVATARDTAWASLLLVTYAIGAALPMLGIAYGGQAVTARVRSVARIVAAPAAGLWPPRDRLRARRLFPVRHADRGVADRLLSHRPTRPLITRSTSQWRPP